MSSFTNFQHSIPENTDPPPKIRRNKGGSKNSVACEEKMPNTFSDDFPERSANEKKIQTKGHKKIKLKISLDEYKDSPILQENDRRSTPEKTFSSTLRSDEKMINSFGGGFAEAKNEFCGMECRKINSFGEGGAEAKNEFIGMECRKIKEFSGERPKEFVKKLDELTSPTNETMNLSTVHSEIQCKKNTKSCYSKNENKNRKTNFPTNSSDRIEDEKMNFYANTFGRSPENESSPSLRTDKSLDCYIPSLNIPSPPALRPVNPPKFGENESETKSIFFKRQCNQSLNSFDRSPDNSFSSTFRSNEKINTSLFPQVSSEKMNHPQSYNEKYISSGQSEPDKMVFPSQATENGYSPSLRPGESLNYYENKKDTNEINIDMLLDRETQHNKTENWNKLDKTAKIQKLTFFSEKYGKENHLSMKEIKKLKTFLVESLDKSKLQKTKDVLYNKETKEIISIPSLYLNTNTHNFSFKITDTKRVSTIKSLTPKRINSFSSVTNVEVKNC
jgi:hypothetical protein